MPTLSSYQADAENQGSSELEGPDKMGSQLPSLYMQKLRLREEKQQSQTYPPDESVASSLPV